MTLDPEWANLDSKVGFDYDDAAVFAMPHGLSLSSGSLPARHAGRFDYLPASICARRVSVFERSRYASTRATASSSLPGMRWP